MEKQIFDPVNKGVRKLAVLFVIAIVLVFALSLGAIWLVPFDNVESYPLNTNTNMAYGATLARNETGVYSAFDHGIVELSSPDKILVEGKCSYLSVSGDTLYFIKDGAFTSMNLFSKQPEAIIKDVSSALVLGRWVYFTNINDGLIYKRRLDSEDITCLNIKPENNNYTVMGTNVYFLDSDGIVKTSRTDGTNIKPFFGLPVDKFSIEGKFLLYIREGNLYIHAIGAKMDDCELLCEAVSYGVVTETVYVVENSYGIQTVDLNVPDKTVSSSVSSPDSAASAVSSKPVVSGGSDGYEVDEDAENGHERQRIETLRAGEKCEYFQTDGSFIYWRRADGSLCRVMPDNTEEKIFK